MSADEAEAAEPAVKPAARGRLATAAAAVLGLLAKGGALLAKGGALLVKGKPLLTALLSVAAYALVYKWWFAVGLVAMIAVHELGHVIALRMMGIAAGLPTFVPFVGAFVRLKERPRTAEQEAWSALAGPALGVLAPLSLLGLAGMLFPGSAADGGGSGGLLLALAYTGCLINLFNLLPMLPFDGGRVAAAISTRLWALGLAGALVALWFVRSVVLVLVLVLGVVELWRRVRARRRGLGTTYYALEPRTRAKVAVAYLGVAALCAAGMVWAYSPA